jgi:hypothetical protein
MTDILSGNEKQHNARLHPLSETDSAKTEI